MNYKKTVSVAAVTNAVTKASATNGGGISGQQKHLQCCGSFEVFFKNTVL